MSALAAVMQKFAPTANNRRIGHIGLECSLTEMHLVQLEADGTGKLSVYALASVAYPCSRDELFNSPKTMRTLVRQALSIDKFQGHKIVSTLPSSNLQVIPVSYHISSGMSDDEALLALLAERLDGDLTDYVIDYTRVRSDQLDEDRQAIVAVAERNFVIRYLEVLRKSGLDVIHLEIGPTAIRRLISAKSTQNEYENVLAINFGRKTSYITVISGSRLLFDQEIRFGEDDLHARLSECLDMPTESVRHLINEYSFDPGSVNNVPEPQNPDTDISSTLQQIVKPGFLKLAEEINRALIYTASQTRGESVNRIYLLGSIARWQGCDALLSSLIHLDVETILNPLQDFSYKRGTTDTTSPEVAVATGLAMHGIVEYE
jgi:type IV pilus assembly protein PilM